MLPKIVHVFKLTSLIQFLKSYQHELPEIITTSLYLMLNVNTSKTFSLSTIIEWNKFDNNIRNLESVSAFNNPHGIKLLTG